MNSVSLSPEDSRKKSFWKTLSPKVGSVHLLNMYVFPSILPGTLEFYSWTNRVMGFPGGSDGKESACNAGNPGLIPGSGRSPGKRKDNPLQYSCLENSMDRGACPATIRGVPKSWTQLSN